MGYFAKSVLTTPFSICLDWAGTTLIGEDCTCINYPLKILLSRRVSKLSGSFSTFQKMYLKQAKGPAKQWWSMKHHGVNITTPPPPSLPLMDWMVVYSPGQERYLKQAKGAAQQELILIGEMWSIKKGILQLHPLPPRLDGSPPTWMGEVLKTSQRVCIVRKYLDWRCMKHQGVSELTPSHLPPPPWNGMLVHHLG